jgi:MATE family multidrug resistance protein
MMSAVNRPQAPLWITLAAIPANFVLVYCLIHGLLGLPELGLFGAGLATTLVNLGTFIAALAIAAWRKPFADYHPLVHLWRIDWPLMRQLIAIGAPISFSLLLEYGLFSSAALLMGLISTTALAAHQIALQVTAVLFMVPLGIGMAATVRVGHAFGRDDMVAVKRAGLVAAVLGIALVAALTIAIILGRYELGRLFLGSGEASAATVELTATLLLVGATFFIADGLQTIMAGALRGINDTRMTLLFAAIGYWCVAFPIAWVLAFNAGLGAVGVWIGFSTGTFVYAGLLILRFRMLTRRLAG